MSDAASGLARAHGEPSLRARMRAAPEDFFVEELDAFEPSGSGEHLLLTVEKRGMNTAFAAQRIARWAGVADSAIGYAGLKDRHAVTRQRFSVWLPKKVAPDTAALDGDDFKMLSAHWHARKLPRGALAGNRFVLTLRDVRGEHAAIEARLGVIGQRGVPNYFGEQRFGRDGGNIAQARAMFAGRRMKREQRSILLSAARSEIFNAVLAERVGRGDWDRGIDGDVFMLDGSHSVFGPLPLDEEIESRLARFDIHPTGAMWGRGATRVTGAAAALESNIAESLRELCEGLEAAGLKQERRSLRLPVRGLSWRWRAGDTLELSFTLPPGAYATVVLRELGEIGGG
ncbi:tRNA pseudouridine(13) synthase TruD [Lysobacter pythonis]|uniref:tRNA pseudouridine synthase D n=1 Tax=Solilutibacter pythonis TaxID=2483112 RepID=A0A3M2HRF8_9GAMM|nr:tRNA pseudouridine(13) synthase TruD [Lysobacter pythonis]RMH88364.1 tRNA pseudouridine(13) synthase TruD [Lysobacter pythonis]